MKRNPRLSDKTSGFLVGLALLVALPIGIAASGVDKATKKYSEWERAAYLTPEQIEFIRPGLQLKIESFTIPSGTLKPVVTFSIKDDMGQPLDRDGILTPAAVSTSWVLSRIIPGDTQYTAYTTLTVTSPITNVTAIQPAADSGGRYSKISDGLYEYSFGTALPAGYPTNATTTLGVYSTRDLRPWGLTRHVANVIQTFVPDGSAVTTVRDVVRTENCNQCHNPLGLHGGARRDTRLCILCHTPQNIDPDTGNTVDFKVMVHKIHRGKNLPSVKAGKPYQIIGFRQTIFDFSTVAFPRDLRNCETCHQKATQATNWFLQPNRAACGSCHDQINWESGAGHAGGRQVSDRFCSTCHFPEGELEFDASIKGGHTIPRKSKQLAGINFEIVNIANALPGSNVRIDFRIKNNKGENIRPNSLSRLGATIAGPTTDYSWRVAERLERLTPQVSGDVNSYNFLRPLPADAKGTFTVGIEGYIDTKLNPGTTKEMSVRDRGDTVFKYVAVTGTTPVSRREVVSDAKCNACHEKLIMHSGNSLRNGVQYCVTCHNPVETDFSERTSSQLPEETLDFRTMIHKIHTGEELERQFSIADKGELEDFSEVRFPGDRRDCQQCHLSGTNELPLPDGRLSVTTKRDFFSPTPPATAACLACHDGRSAAAHAYVNIAPFGEACAACHGTGAEFAVSKVHAR